MLFSVYCYAGKQPDFLGTVQGDLKTIIVVSDSPHNIKKWFNTSKGQDLILHRIFSTQPNQLNVITFLVTGLTANQNNQYHFKINVHVLDPNGTTIFHQNDYAIGQGKLPEGNPILMADPALDFMLEETDPIGIYIIVAEVIDLHNGKTAEQSYEIVLR